MAADPQSSRWEEGMIDQIGLVEYEFNGLEKKVLRRQGDYSQAVNKIPLQSQVALKNIDSLKFEFLYKSPAGYEKKPTAHELIPSAIDVAIEYRDAYKKSQAIHRTFSVPAGI